MKLKVQLETDIEIRDDYQEFCLPTCPHHYGANRCSIFEVKLGLDTPRDGDLLHPVRHARCLAATGTPSTLDPYRGVKP